MYLCMVRKISMLKDAALESSSIKVVSKVELSQLDLEFTMEQENSSTQTHSFKRLVFLKESKEKHLLFKVSVMLVTGQVNSSSRMEVKLLALLSTIQQFIIPKGLTLMM